MAEYLYDLLSVNHFLDITIDISDGFLLPYKVLSAVSGHLLYNLKDNDYKYQYE